MNPAIEDVPVEDRLLEVFKKNQVLPLKLELRPTKKCNLLCRTCWRRNDKGRISYDDELPPERWVELIAEGAELGAKKVELVGGGEPTFDQNAVMDYIHEIKRNNMFGDMTTNGTLFSEDMIREIVELGWDRIMFSLDGPNAAVHDYIRSKKGTFKKVVSTMERFTYWKQKLGLERPLLGMIPVLTNRIHTKFSDFMNLANKVGAYHIGFKPIVLHHEFARELNIQQNQFAEMNASIQKAIPLAEKYSLDTNLRSLIHRPGNEVVKKAGDVTELYHQNVDETSAYLKDRYGVTSQSSPFERFSDFVQIHCYLPWTHLTIVSDGDVLPCSGAGPMDPRPNVKNSSLKEILAGDLFVNFRRQVEQGDYPDVCKGCCVGLFFDNRKHRQALIEKGSDLLESEARQKRKWRFWRR